MTPTEQGRHVFIVRIWFEPREIAGAAPLMRGTIEHLPTGTRGGLTTLGEIETFIGARLREDGRLRTPEPPADDKG